MTFDEKIQVLDAKSLQDVQGIEVEIEPGVKHQIECSRFDYVIWRNSKPFLYTRDYIETHDVDEIQAFIESHSG